MQGQGQGAGIRAKACSQHHQRGPDQFGNRAQGIQQQTRSALQRPAEAPCGGQGQQQAKYSGEQRTEGRHGQGFHCAMADGRQVLGAQVRAEKALHVASHLAQAVAADQCTQVDT